MSKLIYNITADSTIFLSGQDDSGNLFHEIVTKDNPNYRKVISAINDGDMAFLSNTKNYSLEKQKINDMGIGVSYSDSGTYIDGELVGENIANRLLEISSKEKDEYIKKFKKNLDENPSRNSVLELLKFLDNKNLPITEDGCFLAYKSVRSDFFSKYAGKMKLLSGKDKDGRIYNGIGETIECPRNEVDDNKDQHCSNGLHVGAYEYAGHGGFYNNPSDKVLLVKVNPKDVVSVPTDHSFQKVRTCKYEVLAEATNSVSSEYVSGNEYSFSQKLDFDNSVRISSPKQLRIGDSIDFMCEDEYYNGVVTYIEDEECVYVEVDGEEVEFWYDEMENIKLCLS